MIEKILIDFFDKKLNTPAFCEEPEKPPDEYILIEKIGSGRRNFIDRATVAVQSYSTSLYNAALLNARIKNIMYKLDELPQISSCKLNSDYNFTDTETRRYRYQAIFDITYFENEHD